MEEMKLMSDLNFCLKMISQNRLYDAEIDDENGGGGQIELAGWMGRNKTK